MSMGDRLPGEGELSPAWHEGQDAALVLAQPWPRDMVLFRILAREPERKPWSVIDFIAGLVDVGRVHDSAFVIRISSSPSIWSAVLDGLVVVDFYAPTGWTPQADPTLSSYGQVWEQRHG